MCFDGDGKTIGLCNDAPNLNDYGAPLAENLCTFRAEGHNPEMSDPYKQRYTKVCSELDQTLANPYLLDVRIEERFATFSRELDEMIASPELHEGDNGRYLFHIDARILRAALPGFYYRKRFSLSEAIPKDIVAATHREYADILDDFDGLYRDVAWSVAFRRTEVEIGMFLTRKDIFPFPAVFREDSSLTTGLNHDWYLIDPDGNKVTIQVKNTDYRDRKSKEGRPISERYVDSTLVVIHQQIVNLDQKDGEIIETIVEPFIPQGDDEYEEPYAEYDPEHPKRYVAWGAIDKPNDADTDITEHYHFVQKIQGHHRDSMVVALLKEARGEYITTSDMNLLRAGSHYLVAAIREKTQSNNQLE